MKKIYSILVFLLLLGFSGCAQKVQIQALNPAEVGQMASKKRVVVADFKSDTVGLSSKIESIISRSVLDKKKYFTVLNRKSLQKVLEEQEIQSSGLSDEKTAVKVGALIGAEAMMTGEVISSGSEDSYIEDKEKCVSRYKDSGECAQIKYYKVTCRTTAAEVSASLNIVDLEDGTVIYGDTISKSYNGDSCKDGDIYFLDMDTTKIHSKDKALQLLSDAIASDFVWKLVPHYYSFEVFILDSIEFEVTDAQEKKLKKSLKFLEVGRMDRAEPLMSELNDELEGASYVVNYDLGVMKEAAANYVEAKKLYETADSLTAEPVEEINMAMVRIDALIVKQKEAESQIKK